MNNLTTTKIRKYREAFDLYDQNKDGTIKKHDLLPVLRSLRFDPSESEISELCSLMCYEEKEESVKISFEEFMKVMATYKNEYDVSDDEVLNSFKELDKQNTGKLKIEDFRNYLKAIKHNLNEEELDEMFCELDPNNTGEIDYYKLLNKEKDVNNNINDELLD